MKKPKGSFGAPKREKRRPSSSSGHSPAHRPGLAGDTSATRRDFGAAQGGGHNVGRAKMKGIARKLFSISKIV